ncbi:hypothetical protein ACFWPH_24385 [Nocardia sp. NPDC058499]|uniref:TY-Chap domain-containing protein n=1 Tax=Nocardia sp. NPDC058499 TaxID=3346530 RepID=UPI00365B009D
MSEWPEFAAGLAEQLAGLPGGAILTIVEAEGSRYAQFRQFDDLLYAELVGDEWLAPEKRAGDSGARLLAEAGWQRPDRYHTDNWWIEYPWPLTPQRYRDLVSIVLIGLRRVFEIAEPADLVYNAWNTEDGDRDLVLPGLGLRRVSK